MRLGVELRSQSVVPGPTESASPRNLLKMHILGSPPDKGNHTLWEGAQGSVFQHALLMILGELLSIVRQTWV